MTLVTLLVALVVGRMAQYTSDQVMVQRLQTTRSLQEARQAFIVNAAGDALWMIGLSFVGFALFAYFQRHAAAAGVRDRQAAAVFHVAGVPGRRGRPGDRRDHGGVAVEHRLGDQLVHLGGRRRSLQPRLEGRRRARRRRIDRRSEREQVRVSRIATVMFGVLGTVLACNVARIGTLLEINAKVVNAFTGPLFGIFLLAMFSRRASAAPPRWSPASPARSTAYYVAYHSTIGFMWPSTFGLAATLAVGAGLALVWPAAAGGSAGGAI